MADQSGHDRGQYNCSLVWRHLSSSPEASLYLGTTALGVGGQPLLLLLPVGRHQAQSLQDGGGPGHQCLGWQEDVLTQLQQLGQSDTPMLQLMGGGIKIISELGKSCNQDWLPL